MSHVKRIIGFALIPGLTMVSTLVLLPIISARFGPAGWSAVGLGQSVGAFLSIVAGLAWQVVGAQQVAVSTPEGRQVIYAESLKTRGCMLLLLAPIAGIACYFLAPSYRWECVAFMIATGLNCFNASWFFAGTGQSKYVIRNEASIRLTGYLVSIPVLAATNSLWAYAAVLICTGVLMAAANMASIFSVFSRNIWRMARPTHLVIFEQLHGMVSRGLSAGHQHLGITVVSVLAPQSLPIYSALDTMQKAANNATSFYPQAFAWWVGSPKTVFERRPRIRKLMWVSLGLGLFVLVGWMAAGPSLLGLLYNGAIDVHYGLHFWTACGMAGFTVSRALGQLCLVPLGLQVVVYRGATVCSVIGLPGIGIGIWFADVAGALASSAIAYAGLCLFYLIAIRAGLKGPQQTRKVKFV